MGGRPKPICDIIEDVEEDTLNKIIGCTSYELLKADLVDYSSVQKWSDEGKYLAGQFVQYEGDIYVANKDVTNNNAPSDCLQWDEAPAFNTDCYNETWYEGGLRDIVCWYIFLAAAPSYPQILDVAGFSDSDDPNMIKKIQFYLNDKYRLLTIKTDRFLRWNTKNGCIKINCLNIVTNENRTDRKVNW